MHGLVRRRNNPDASESECAIAYAILGLIFWVTAGAQPAGGDKVLERLRGLVGTWEGTLQWSGARTHSGKARATFELTGAGSAVVEHLFMGDATIASMSSVYHLDGSDLRITHYCGANNQPRLKASSISDDQSVVHFSFIDATNLAKHPAHVEAVELRFPAPDRLVIRFTFTGDGKTSIEHIELTRVR